MSRRLPGGRTAERDEAGNFPPFAVTVDLVVLTIRSGRLAVLLVERGEEPYLGSWALPGGFVRPDENLDAAALRELVEETQISGLPGHLEQLRTYGDPGRDPRMRVVSIAYVAFVPQLPDPVPGTDAARARWWAVDDLATVLSPRALSRKDALPLAFDHVSILSDAVERVAAKLEYTPLATAFCPSEFTIGELSQVYEAVWGVPPSDRANFRRKVLATAGFAEPVDEGTQRLTGGLGRPAQLFRVGPALELSPPLRRPHEARRRQPAGAPERAVRARPARGRPAGRTFDRDQPK